MIPAATFGIGELLAAKRPEDVFGVLDGPPEEQLMTARMTYRRLAREVHPDVTDDARASHAFGQLTKLWNAAKAMIGAGTYGTRAVAVDPVVVRTRRRAFKISELYAAGDSCNVYRATYEHEGVEADGIVKVVRDRKDNDLVQNEAKVLKAILGDVDAFDTREPFFPTYLEAFGYRPPGIKQARQAVAFALEPGLYSLEDVRSRYPAGVHPKDMAWMFRKLLFTLGHAHAAGFVHGAVLPEHVLIQPENHGLVLIDWKYSVPMGKRIRAISARRREWYPPEVFDKEPAAVGTDIFMAALSMLYVMSELDAMTTLPRPLQMFFRGCTLRQPKNRPRDAFALHDEFTELIERLWGRRTFRPFSM